MNNLNILNLLSGFFNAGALEQNNQNNITNTPSAQNSTMQSDYPEVFFTDGYLHKHQNYDINQSAQQYQNSQFDMLKNLLPVVLGKNGNILSKIMGNENSLGDVFKNNINMSQILSAFSKTDKKHTKEKQKDNEENIIDLTNYIEVS